MHRSSSSPVTRSDVAVRVTKRQVRTAVWTFTHPRTRRTVNLVGTLHIGEPEYFRELSAWVEDLWTRGAEIHVEGINQRHEESLSDWERERLGGGGRGGC